MKAAMILSGCGVYDGSEIHEAVFAMLALNRRKIEVECYAPDIEMHHVINHLTGEEMPERRNVLNEAARIARGKIQPLSQASPDQFDLLVLPGGFGVAKNLSQWAFAGPEGAIDETIKNLIVATVASKKPIAAFCMAPVVIAKALEGSGVSATLTVGTTQEASPYDIDAISAGMEATGAKSKLASVRESVIDTENKIVTTPCYMMEATVFEVHEGIEAAIENLLKFS